MTMPMIAVNTGGAPPWWFFLYLAGVAWVAMRGVAWTSGWRTLARRFASRDACMGPSWRMQSLRLRFGAAYNCVTVGAAADGLHLSLAPWLFFMGHAPLVVPWSEISRGVDKHAWHGRWVQYLLGAEERIPMSLRGRLADRIEQARRENFPVG